MNKFRCKNCGGNVSPSDIMCEYCGSAVEAQGSLLPEDKKRMVSVAKIMSRALDSNAVAQEYSDNRVYVYVNMLLTAFSGWAVLFVSSWISAAVISLLLAFLVFAVYSEEYWYLLQKETEGKIYESRIKPAIENFLKAFNYYGAHWREVVTELLDNNIILDGRDFFRREYSLEPDKNSIYARLEGIWNTAYNKISDQWGAPADKLSSEPVNSGARAVLIRSAEILGDYAYAAMSRRKARVYLAAGYTAAVFAAISYLFIDTFWIPLIWTVPVLVFIILLALDKIYVYAIDFDYKYDPHILKEKIIPRLETYCKEAGTDFPELLEIAGKMKLFELHEQLEKYNK